MSSRCILDRHVALYTLLGVIDSSVRRVRPRALLPWARIPLARGFARPRAPPTGVKNLHGPPRQGMRALRRVCGTRAHPLRVSKICSLCSQRHALCSTNIWGYICYLSSHDLKNAQLLAKDACDLPQLIALFVRHFTDATRVLAQLACPNRTADLRVPASDIRSRLHLCVERTADGLFRLAWSSQLVRGVGVVVGVKGAL